MRKSLVSKYTGLLFASYILSFAWWNLWMYSGVIGPIPFLHWFVISDGESSYDLTQYEMCVHLVLFIKIVLVLYRTKSNNHVEV